MQDQQGPRSPLAQRLAALGQRQVEGKTVGELLTEAQESLVYSPTFRRAIGECDALGIAYLRNILGYPLPKATREWFAKPLAEQIGYLIPIASGNEVARQALEVIQAFRENDLLFQTLLTVVDEIGRPSRGINSEAQFSGFIENLAIKGLARKTQSAPGWQKAFKWGNMYYSPPSLVKARLAWPFVVQALLRVRRYAQLRAEVIPRIQALLDQATLENDPEEQTLYQLISFPERAGSLVIWDSRSRIGQDDAGLLAVLIGRLVASSNLLILGWEADRPLSLPKEETYELPPLLVPDGLELGWDVGFAQTQTRLPKDEHFAIMRVQWLIRFWLRQEGKFRILALKESESGTSR